MERKIDEVALWDTGNLLASTPFFPTSSLLLLSQPILSKAFRISHPINQPLFQLHLPYIDPYWTCIMWDNSKLGTHLTQYGGGFQSLMTWDTEISRCSLWILPDTRYNGRNLWIHGSLFSRDCNSHSPWFTCLRNYWLCMHVAWSRS